MSPATIAKVSVMSPIAINVPTKELNWLLKQETVLLHGLEV